MRLFISLLFFYPLLTLSAPLEFQRLDQASIAKDSVIFAKDGWALTKGQEQVPDNLYVVHHPSALQSDFHVLSSYGEVLAEAPGAFSAMILPPENVEILAARVHVETHACGAIIYVSGESVELAPSGPLAAPQVPIGEKNARVSTLAKEVKAANIRKTVEEMVKLGTRYHRSEGGFKTPRYLREKYQSAIGKNEGVSITLYKHRRTNQESIIVRIEGTTKPYETVVVGSHIDSISWPRDNAPGADDNASGTAVNHEVFRILMENKIRPERSIEIHGYAAEEVGLVGSFEIAREYKSKGTKVVAMLQNDMNLYLEKGQESKIHFIKNGTSKALNEEMVKLVRHYSKVKHQMSVLRGGTSDHAAWNSQGFHAVFPFENPSKYNRRIHTKSDTIEHSGNFEQSAEFAKLTLSFLLHYAGF